jgi:hypothetical protein
MSEANRVIKTFSLVALPITFGVLFLIYLSMEMYGRMTGSDYFSIQSVEVLTEGPASKEELTKLAAIRLKTNIFFLDLQKAKTNLEKNPWIASASVTRALPNRVLIQYVPHEPIAVVNASGLYYLNRDGNLFYRLGKGDSLDYPFINLEGGGIRTDPVRERLRSAVRIFTWAKSSKVVSSRDIGDVSVHGSEYHSDDSITATVYYPPAQLRKKTNAKARLISMSFSEKDMDSQFLRAERLLQELTQHMKNPKLIRLELGKKVVVKVAQ